VALWAKRRILARAGRGVRLEYDYRPMAVNLFGLDVGALDVRTFLAASRVLYPALALVWLALLLRVRKAWWLLAGALLANAYAWLVTNYPLLRIYALGPSRDRVSNVALCQVVAAGNSPLQTWQVGQLHFEPFWGLLVAAVSGWSPDRVLALYPFFALAAAAGFALSLYCGLRPPAATAVSGEDGAWSAWERALVAGFATLLCASPLDFTGIYRPPWSMTFLLKPNHAVGLVLFPLVLRAFVRIRGWRGRIGTGLLLHLLGWAFILHMAYAAFGLVVFAAWSLLQRRAEAGRDTKDALAVIGVNALIVSPYVLMLLLGYPFLVANPAMTINPLSPHLLETTTRSGWVFALGLWGTAVAYRRGDRQGRLWAAQVAGAYLIWCGYLVLSAIQMARERDEIFNWLRFLTAASAGMGAWDLGRRLARWTSRPWPAAARAAAAAALALPWSLPYWWDPLRMDPYFPGSLRPIPESIRAPNDFLREKTERRAVVATGDHEFARWVPALGARRVLLGDHLHSPKDRSRRETLEQLLVTGADPAAAGPVAAAYGVRYMVVTPELAARHGVALASLRARPDLRLAHLTGDGAADWVAIFEIVSKAR
jgi:hypothetical protein